MSVIDEIIGVAMSAGSMPIFFAAIGNIPPIIFANKIISNIAMLTVAAISVLSPSRNMIFAKFNIERTKPMQKLILISFHSTRKASDVSLY